MAPHWLQCTVPELPFPPFVRPLLVLFFGTTELLSLLLLNLLMPGYLHINIYQSIGINDDIQR
jgi:hypothetical protein